MIKPQNKYLHIKPIEIETQTAHGIYTSPKTVSGKQPIEERGEVIAVGPDVAHIKPGDVVYFKEYNLDRVELGSFTKPITETFLMEDYVIAIESAK